MSRRHRLRLVIALCALASLFACTRSPQPPQGLDTFAVLSLAADAPISAAELVLAYEVGALELSGITPKDGTLAKTFDDGMGRVTVALVATQPVDGTLLAVSFRELQPDGEVTLVSARAYAADENEVQDAIRQREWQRAQRSDPSATYDLESRALSLAALIETQAVHPADLELEPAFAAYRLGDMNQDGEIDVRDVLKVLNIAVERDSSPSAYQWYHADLDSNGIVDVTDVLKLLRKAVDPTLPAELQVAPSSRAIPFKQLKDGTPILVGNAGNQPLSFSVSATAGLSLNKTHGIADYAAGYVIEVTPAWKYGSVTVAAGSAGNKTILVGNLTVLIAGQSNASGAGLPLDPREAGNPAVRMFGNDYAWKEAYEPVNDNVGQVDKVSEDSGVNVNHSFGVRLGKRLHETLGHPVYLIPSAKGSSSATEWLPPSNRLNRDTLFGSANYRSQVSAGWIESANPTVEPEGGPVGLIVWYQGESDRGSSAQAEYIRRTEQIMDAFIAELHNPAIVYVQLGGRLSDETANMGYQGIRERQRRLETNFGESGVARDNFFMVVAHDLPLSDVRHLSAEGQRLLGDRIALAYRERVLGEAVDGTGPRLVDITLSGNVIKVTTTQPINASTGDGNTAYEGYFTVFIDGTVVNASELSIRRDPNDATAVQLTLANTPPSGSEVEIRYLPPHTRPVDNQVSGCNPSCYVKLEHVVKSQVSGLPLPAFGPLTVPYTP